MGEIAAVVLAGGASSRLGRPKQALSFGDVTLLEHVIRNVESSGVDTVIVVVNATLDGVTHGRPGRARFVVNHQAATGAASSLQAGIAAAADAGSGDLDAVVVVLGDMPDVVATAIDRAVSAWRGSRPWAAMSTYDDAGIAHPMVFSADAFGDLASARGDKSVWRMLRQRHDVVLVAQSGPTPPDVDTWDDYAALCATHGFTPDLTPR